MIGAPHIEANAVPIHERIYQEILQQIAEGRYPPGAKLPTEKELMEHYGVSRAPVRQALGRLESQGKVFRRPGHGTEVAEASRDAWAELSGFAQFYMENLEHVSGQLLGLAHIPVPESVAGPLQLSPDATVTLLKRLRVVNGNPVAFMLNYLPAMLAIDESADFFALSDLMQHQWNMNEESARESLWAVPADAETAHWLDVPVGTPVLQVGRLSLDAGGRPVAYSLYRVRSDRMTYQATLTRHQR